MNFMHEISLSDYGQASTTPSPVAQMMASFANTFRPAIDINLGVGYVNENTIPRQFIADAVNHIVAHHHDFHAPFNYGSPDGVTELIAAIRTYLAYHHFGNLTPASLAKLDMIIGANGATSLLDAMTQILPRGIVVTTDPLYYIYTNQLQRAGFELLSVPEDRDGIRTDVLADKIKALGPRRSEISFVYIVTVNNPSCSILTTQRRIGLLRLMNKLCTEQRRKIPLIMDTAYEQLIHDPDTPTPDSALLHDELGIVHEIGTLSKTLAPTLRVGYMLAKPSPFLDAMVQKVSDTGFSAPLLNQHIAALLLDQHASEQIKAVKTGYREKAVQTRKWIEEYLGDEVESIIGGRAGFYFYLTFKNTQTHQESAFFKFLSRHTGDQSIDAERNPTVIYIPGNFCVNPQGDMAEQGQRQLRLSFGYESLDRIHTAIKRMGDALAYVRAR
ncbi:MAG: aminotransferase class I/II-fold pyridoxal phosphate-dependent enzyme [Phycisphaeraceae bacterium JB051]